ncbi:MAG: Wzz/FepE/Etk N-terminal domain-containing protein [Pseudomonadota bacterium]
MAPHGQPADAIGAVPSRFDGRGTSARAQFLEALLEVWRAKTLILIVFVAFLFAGYAAGAVWPKTYTASARLLLSDGLSGARELALAQSGVVATAVSEKLKEGGGASTFNVDLDASVLSLSVSSNDPQLAAAAANSGLDRYLSFRQIARERDDLDAVSADEISIAPSTASIEASARLSALLAEAEADLRAAETRYEVLNRLRQTTPIEIELFAETDGSRRLLELYAERDALVRRYPPGSAPLRAISDAIANLEAMSTQSGAGATRRGVNPVFLDLSTDAARLEADLSAAKSRIDELQRQSAAMSSVEMADRQKAATDLNPGPSRATVFVLERAAPPKTGTSPKEELLILSIWIGLVAALVAGVLRTTLRRGVSTARSAERALGLPVLAEAPIWPSSRVGRV